VLDAQGEAFQQAKRDGKKPGLTSLGAGDALSVVILNTGTIQSGGANRAGSVNVVAGSGAISNEGSLDASVARGSAGSVTVHAPGVVNSGEVRADAQQGRAGSVTLTSEASTRLEAGSVVSASGGSGVADGGRVLVHSFEGSTRLETGALVDLAVMARSPPPALLRSWGASAARHSRGIARPTCCLIRWTSSSARRD
jgi:hypothetical protein